MIQLQPSPSRVSRDALDDLLPSAYAIGRRVSDQAYGFIGSFEVGMPVYRVVRVISLLPDDLPTAQEPQ